MRAVTTPTGTSCGSRTVRASVSTQTRKTAPASAATGGRLRGAEPGRGGAPGGRPAGGKTGQGGEGRDVRGEGAGRLLPEGEGVERGGVTEAAQQADGE